MENDHDNNSWVVVQEFAQPQMHRSSATQHQLLNDDWSNNSSSTTQCDRLPPAPRLTPLPLAASYDDGDVNGHASTSMQMCTLNGYDKSSSTFGGPAPIQLFANTCHAPQLDRTAPFGTPTAAADPLNTLSHTTAVLEHRETLSSTGGVDESVRNHPMSADRMPPTLNVAHRLNNVNHPVENGVRQPKASRYERLLWPSTSTQHRAQIVSNQTRVRPLRRLTNITPVAATNDRDYWELDALRNQADMNQKQVKKTVLMSTTKAVPSTEVKRPPPPPPPVTNVHESAGTTAVSHDSFWSEYRLTPGSSSSDRQKLAALLLDPKSDVIVKYRSNVRSTASDQPTNITQEQAVQKHEQNVRTTFDHLVEVARRQTGVYGAFRLDSQAVLEARSSLWTTFSHIQVNITVQERKRQFELFMAMLTSRIRAKVEQMRQEKGGGGAPFGKQPLPPAAAADKTTALKDYVDARVQLTNELNRVRAAQNEHSSRGSTTGAINPQVVVRGNVGLDTRTGHMAHSSQSSQFGRNIAPPPAKRANLTRAPPTVTVTVRATDRPIDLADLCPGGEPKDDDDGVTTVSSESKLEIDLDSSTTAQDNGEIEPPVYTIDDDDTHMQMMMKQYFSESDYARPLSNTSIKTPGRVRVLANAVGHSANHSQSMRGRYGKLGRPPKHQLMRTFEELVTSDDRPFNANRVSTMPITDADTYAQLERDLMHVVQDGIRIREHRERQASADLDEQTLVDAVVETAVNDLIDETERQCAEQEPMIMEM